MSSSLFVMSDMEEWKLKPTVNKLIWNCSYGIHPRRSNCKQALPQGDPLPSTKFNLLYKHSQLWHRKNWLLLHDNTAAYHSVLIQGDLAEQQVTVLPHHPNSPDHTPCDFFVSPLLKEKLHKCWFQSAKEIITATKEAIWDLPAYIFEQCFQQLYQYW
jgi:hypothetical protein